MSESWKEIAPETLKLRLEAGEMPVIVDVRTAPEVFAYHIPGVVWIPLNELAHRYTELEPERETILLCEHGIRSVMACLFLHERGFQNLGNMTGGMSEWTGSVERGLPKRD